MFKNLLFGLLFISVIAQAKAQENSIQIKLNTDTLQEVLFARYLLDKLYVVDTLTKTGTGEFIIEQKDTLPEGIYALAFNVDGGNSILQFCLDNSVSNYAFEIKDIKDPQGNLIVKGSPAASALNDYMLYLKERSLEASTFPEDEKKAEKLAALTERVNAYQNEFVEQYKGTLPAAFVGASMPIDIPDFSEIEDQNERNIARWWYSKEHFFDYLDLQDDRLLYTPFLFNKINEYFDKLTSPAPDSINKSLKVVLDQMDPKSDLFRAYLSNFLTKYATSKIIGYDEIYVFLADEYYAKDFAYWIDEEKKAKIVDEANKIKPTLIGKIAPDITLQNKAGEQIRLHEFESKYTVLLFWAPDCGHCKKSMPDIIEFYNKYKDQGVEILGICTKFHNDAEKCWDFVEEKGINIWENTMDPYHRSRYKILYNINSTPQIFILDEKKEILLKRIASEQLDEVMQNLLETPEG